MKIQSLWTIPTINTVKSSHLFFWCKTSSYFSLNFHSFRNCGTSKAPTFINLMLCSIYTVLCTRISVSFASDSSNLNVFLRRQNLIESMATRETTPIIPAIPKRMAITTILKIRQYRFASIFDLICGKWIIFSISICIIFSNWLPEISGLESSDTLKVLLTTDRERISCIPSPICLKYS